VLNVTNAALFGAKFTVTSNLSALIVELVPTLVCTETSLLYAYFGVRTTWNTPPDVISGVLNVGIRH